MYNLKIMAKTKTTSRIVRARPANPGVPPLPECAAGKFCLAPCRALTVQNLHKCFSCSGRIHSYLQCGKQLSVFLEENPRLVGTRTYDGRNEYARNNDNETKAICHTCINRSTSNDGDDRVDDVERRTQHKRSRGEQSSFMLSSSSSLGSEMTSSSTSSGSDMSSSSLSSSSSSSGSEVQQSPNRLGEQNSAPCRGKIFPPPKGKTTTTTGPGGPQASMTVSHSACN